MDKSKMSLILASASPRRRELLAMLGVKFEILVAPITEHEEPTAEPRGMVLHNAALKAAWVCAQRPGALVLAADTTVALDNHVLNKPRDLDEARAMLRRLSGRTHTVYTGVCLWRNVGMLESGTGVGTPLRGVRRSDESRHGRLGEASLPKGPPIEITHCETSEVTFRVFDDAVIAKYFALVNPLDKAGAYGIQEGRELILHKYTGSLSNIMGLPLEWLAAQLHGLALIPAPTAPTMHDSRFHDRPEPTAQTGSRPE
jgi:septum formation protein